MHNNLKEEFAEIVYDKFLDIKELLDDMPNERAIEAMLYILISMAITYEGEVELHSSDFSSEKHLNALSLVEEWIDAAYQLVQDANKIH
tara:strand:+ start:35 stop:301 length:267 start_codon:yes stop_codon:yes gene_type:complete